MKAIVYENYGSPDVLKLRDVEKPTPKDDEVLVKIHTAAVTPSDCELRSFNFPVLWFWIPLRLYMGIFKPRMRKIPGSYFAGEIETVGKDVKEFEQGDRVFASSGIGLGAYAAYVSLKSTSSIAIMPSNMTYEEAASVPLGGLNALHFLRMANIQKGQKVLINGAAGSIGSFAVQIAKSYGADVTGVDSTDKLDMLRSIGANHVIDYTKEDFTNNGKRYDVILSVVAKASYSRILGSLNNNGVYLLANPKLSDMIRSIWTALFSGKKVLFRFAGEKVEDLVSLRELAEEGKIRSVIDKRFSLEDAVNAHRYIDSGKKIGNVVITI